MDRDNTIQQNKLALDILRSKIFVKKVEIKAYFFLNL